MMPKPNNSNNPYLPLHFLCGSHGLSENVEDGSIQTVNHLKTSEVLNGFLEENGRGFQDSPPHKKTKLDCSNVSAKLEQLEAKVDELKTDVGIIKHTMLSISQDMMLIKQLLLNVAQTNGTPVSSCSNEDPESQRIKDNVQSILLPGFTLNKIESNSKGRKTKIISQLIQGVFTLEELLASSVTGQKTTRPGLDQQKLNIIIEYASHFHDMESTEAKTLVASKLKYMRSKTPKLLEDNYYSE